MHALRKHNSEGIFLSIILKIKKLYEKRGKSVIF